MEKTYNLDVVTAFLNPAIDDDVYMVLPKGIPGAGTTVKLKKALYGLKTAPRLWYQEINSFLISLGFIQSLADPNLYIKRSIDNSGSIYLLLYVDDMKIFYPQNAKAAVDYIKSRLMKQYRITNLGPTRQFLGIDIERHADGSISLGQPAYVKLILKRFRMEDAHPVSTPLDPHVKLDEIAETTAETALDDKGTKLYQAIVGSLMYAALATRPDIAFAVAALCRYNANPQPGERKSVV